MLLVVALAHILWAAEPGGELWGRLWEPSVCDRLSHYLWMTDIDPLTPEAEPPSQQYVAGMQTAAALNIPQLALPGSSSAESESQLTAPQLTGTASAALLNVQQWALETLATGKSVVH